MSTIGTADRPALLAGIRSSGAYHKLLAFSGLIALLVVFSLASPNFLQTANVLAILQATSVNGVLALLPPSSSSPAASICRWGR